MREGNRFSIENDSGLWRKQVGAMLGVVASAALAISGCGAPISETATATATATTQEQTESTDDSIPDLDWQVIDQGCTDEASCEPGEVVEGSVEKACAGTTLLYRYEGFRRAGLAAVPNSPECTASQAPESSPTPVATATPTPAG